MALGSGTGQLWALASSGTNPSNAANALKFGSLNMDNSGNLSFTSASTSVPLPAAVWLLGSGLLGLAGVGRRRAA